MHFCELVPSCSKTSVPAPEEFWDGKFDSCPWYSWFGGNFSVQMYTGRFNQDGEHNLKQAWYWAESAACHCPHIPASVLRPILLRCREAGTCHTVLPADSSTFSMATVGDLGLWCCMFQLPAKWGSVGVAVHTVGFRSCRAKHQAGPQHWCSDHAAR